MTQGRDPGHEEDWGAQTDWQAPPPPPPQGAQPTGGFQGASQQQFPPAPPWTQGWQGGAQPGGWPGRPPPPPPTWMVPAVLVTLFCFLPTGIVAIVHAAQVSSKHNAGDHAGAGAASAKAKQWVIVSVVLGLILWVVILSGLSSTGGYYY